MATTVLAAAAGAVVAGAVVPAVVQVAAQAVDNHMIITAILGVMQITPLFILLPCATLVA